MTTKVIKEMLAEGVQDTLDFVSSLPPVEDASPFTVSEYLMGAPNVLMQRLITDITDDQMFQRAANMGGTWIVPPGEYTVSSVIINNSVTFQCNPSVKFLRPANGDPDGTYIRPGIACFDITTNGVDVKFTGGFIYDGQGDTQVETFANGFFLRSYIPTYDPLRGDVNISLESGVFTHGSVGYLYIRGDDINRRYETKVSLSNCRFHETKYGIGSGQVTPESVGYTPTYIFSVDYVRLSTMNFYADWVKDVEVGQYAASAIMGTFGTGSYETAGGSIISMHGLTTLKNLGRGFRNFDDTAWDNNAIGVIDGYGNIDSLYIENLYAVDSKFVTVRAKGSINTFTVLKGRLINCHRGIQVGSSSTGPCQAVINVSNITCTGGTVPQLEFSGNSDTNALQSVNMGPCILEGTYTNPEGLASITSGIINMRNVTRVYMDNPKILQSPVSGIVLRTIVNARLSAPEISNTTSSGVYVADGMARMSISDMKISSTGGASVSYQPGSVSRLSITGGSMDGAVNSGVFINSSDVDATVSDTTVSNISGSSRGYYISANSVLRVYNNRALSGVTTPTVTAAGGSLVASDNSWNPTEKTLSGVPTTGTYKVGDRVMNSAPVAGGNIGWVCTVAGTPGTWKTFGTIEA